jgi:urea carboxylase
MDSLAFRLANLLVGNAAGAAALEIQFTGPTLAFHAESAFALTGPGCDATLDGQAIPLWQTVRVRDGQVLRCPFVRNGARLYLAVCGGIEGESVFGSRSTFWQAGIGGQALKHGDALSTGPHLDSEPIRWVPPNRRPKYAETIEAEVTSGPHFDWLSEHGQRILLTTAWRVTGRSDRTGIRLGGPPLDFADGAINKAPEHGPEPTNVVNTGYPVGGLNLCGDTPIILPVDGPSMGGFITPIVVASAALWKVGQARPGQTIGFRLIPITEAIALRRQLEQHASNASIAMLSIAAPTAQ